MPFNPKVGEKLKIDGTTYRFLVHPASGKTKFLWKMEGGFGFVYPLAPKTQQPTHALKQFKRSRRVDPSTRERLHRVQGRLGFLAAERYWLPSDHKVKQLRDAALMPWVHGASWAAVMESTADQPPDDHTCADLLAWAKQFTTLLAEAEKDGIAHGDISAGNVIVRNRPASDTLVELVDLEDIFVVDAPAMTESAPLGTRGYATLEQPTYCPEGDRFGALMLTCEMLLWAFPDIRKTSAGAPLFVKAPIGAHCPELDMAVRGLRETSPALADLLDTTWRAANLQKAAALAELRELVNELPDDACAPRLSGPASGAAATPSSKPIQPYSADERTLEERARERAREREPGPGPAITFEEGSLVDRARSRRNPPAITNDDSKRLRPPTKPPPIEFRPWRMPGDDDDASNNDTDD